MTIQQTRITIGSLKVAEFASEETTCFSATVYLDGKAFARASNEGRGGNTNFEPLGRKGWNDPAFQKMLKEAEAFASSFPPEVTEYDDPQDPSQKMTIPYSLEYLVNGLVEDTRFQKRMASAYRRTAKRRVLFLKPDGKVYQTAVIPDLTTNTARIFDVCQKIKAKNPEAVILNMLPPAKAVELFIKANLDQEEAA